jgi:F-type H+-transporting ATPase subunit delta
MSAHDRSAQQLARQLFKLSLVDGTVSPERVTGVLEFVEKNRPANPVVLLRAYRRLVAAEIGRGQALVEHAGAVSRTMLDQIAASLTKKYGRPVTTTARANPALLGGLRVHIGDDVYESSLANQLATLASSL